MGVNYESMLWLADHRCKRCVHNKTCDGSYKVEKSVLGAGWVCYGYKESHWEGVEFRRVR